MFETVIRGCWLLDGLGSAPRLVDLGLAAGRVQAIERPGALGRSDCESSVDAYGLALMPGIMDIHTHYDLCWDWAELEPHCWRQGVTSVVAGNCGMGPADVASHLDSVAARGLGLRYGVLASHGPLRCSHVPRALARPAYGPERRLIADSVRQALDAGALGLSFGPYDANTLADEDELVEAARVLAERDRLFVSHRRCEGPDVIGATKEFLRITAKAGVRAHISHLKVAGRRHWPKFAEMMALIQVASAERDVGFDLYPYDGSLTYLAAMLPSSAKADGRLGERLADPSSRGELRGAIHQWFRDRQGPEDVISFGARKVLQLDRTPTLSEAAAIMNEADPAEAALRLIEAWLPEHGGWTAYRGMMSSEHVEQLLADPRAIIASDAVPEEGLIPKETHPRAYGTFARVLGDAAREGLSALAAAVPAMTSRPAQRYGFAELGRIKVGAMADLVLIEPAKLRALASYESPALYPEGIAQVFIGGRSVWKGQCRDQVAQGSILGR
jgi:N-acyl-D-amino-acid deacylase